MAAAMPPPRAPAPAPGPAKSSQRVERGGNRTAAAEAPSIFVAPTEKVQYIVYLGAV